MHDVGKSHPVSNGEQSEDVFEQEQSGPWLHSAYECDDVIPEPPFIFDPLLTSGLTHRLAREPRDQDIHGGRFVDLAEIPKIRNAGKAGLEDFARRWFDLREPDRFNAQPGSGQVQPAYPAAQ